MNSLKRIAVLLTGAALLGGCTPSFLYLSDPNVYVRKELPSHDITTKLTILPFESPSYYPEIGMYTAKLFFERLLGKERFEVAFSQSTEWYEKGGSWDGQTLLALEEGRRREGDYILMGSIDYYMVGRITSNKITLTARLLEVKTGETIYYATGYGSGKPGKTFLLSDLKRGESTPPATAVLSAVVDQLIKDCFDRKKINVKHLGSLW